MGFLFVGLFVLYYKFLTEQNMLTFAYLWTYGPTTNYLQAEAVPVFQLENCMKRLIFCSHSLRVFSSHHSYPVVYEVRNLWQRLLLHFKLIYFASVGSWKDKCVDVKGVQLGLVRRIYLYSAESSLYCFIENNSVRGEIDWLFSLSDPILPLWMNLIS